MVIFALIILIIGVIGLVFGGYLFTADSDRKIAKFISGGLCTFGGLIIALNSFVIINPGEIGLQILFGKLKKEIFTEGFHIKNPFVKVVKMDIRTQAYTMSKRTYEGQIKGDDAIRALSKDGLQLVFDITVWFRLDPSRAVEVYRKIGKYYVYKIVRPAIRTAIRDAAALYNAVSVYSEKRQEFSNKIAEILEPQLKERGIVLEKVLVRNIDLPTKVKAAIEAKLEAEQEAEKMRFVLEKEKREAERKRVEAEGIADAQRIIANSLTSNYLQWYYINTLKELINSPNNTVVVLPFDQRLTPLIQIPQRGGTK